jgi:predicted nucleotide-binding protein
MAARERNASISNTGNANNINQGGKQTITQGDIATGDAGTDAGTGRTPGDATGDAPGDAPENAPGDEAAGRAREADRSRSVFVVYGRDEQARLAIFRLLRDLDLRPLEWEPLVRGGKGGITPFLGQVVADAPSQAQAAVVILTPDDEVMLHQELRHPHEDQFELHPAMQARPNVLIELGIVLAVYPENTIIVEFGDMRPIADLAGRNVIRFHEGTPVAETARKIAGRLEKAECALNDSGNDWLNAEAFTNMQAYYRKPR